MWTQVSRCVFCQIVVFFVVVFLHVIACVPAAPPPTPEGLIKDVSCERTLFISHQHPYSQTKGRDEQRGMKGIQLR